jgi:hypothetical protein
MSELQALQRGMARALQRAGQADDRQLAARVREDGRRFAVLLNGLVQSSRLYSADNAALEAPSQECANVLAGLVRALGAVHLVCVEDQVYVNDVRLRVRLLEQSVLDHLIAELRRHDAGGLSFHAPLDAAAMRGLARALAGPADRERPRVWLGRSLAALGELDVAGHYRFRVRGETAAVQHDHDTLVQRAAAVLEGCVADLAASRLANPLLVRREVIDLVDSLARDAGRGAAEPLRRRAMPPAHHHAVSVCVLSLLVGRALGLPEDALSDLGVAAMLHDLGHVRDPERHAEAGACLLLGQRGFHEGKIRRLRLVLEHHESGTGGGSDASGVSLFARILHIADDYDLLASTRPGGAAVPPPTAQGALWAARGERYDADLLALFVQVMGLYPPGSLIELSDGRWVVTVSGGRDRQRFAWPVVRVVRDVDGRPPDDLGNELNLFALRNLIRPRRVLNPATQGIELAALLDGIFR